MEITSMELQKNDNQWKITLPDNSIILSVFKIVQFLENVIEEVIKSETSEIRLEIDMRNIKVLHSSLVAKFILLQNELVKKNGNIFLINVQKEVSYHIEMLMIDKIIPITYEHSSGEETKESVSFEENLKEESHSQKINTKNQKNKKLGNDPIDTNNE